MVATLPVCVLTGAAHAAPVMAYSASQEDDGGFALLNRFVVVPMFLFAGTFFPVDRLPPLIQPLAWVTPLWHATEITRAVALQRAQLLPTVVHLGYLLAWALVGLWFAARAFRRRLVE